MSRLLLSKEFKGRNLQVREGDITKEQTDAIVNAANSRLAHGGGLARAIVKAGGDIIQRESDQWIQEHGSVPVGGAAITSAGSMPAKYVIHAVGPIWKGGSEGEPELLSSAVKSALKMAEKHQLSSLSIPAISTGIFGYPKELGTEQIVRAVRDYFLENPQSTIREGRFVAFDRETSEAFQKGFEKVFSEG